MASVAVDSLSKDAKDQLVCTYAALLLHDGELEITVSSALRGTEDQTSNISC